MIITRRSFVSGVLGTLALPLLPPRLSLPAADVAVRSSSWVFQYDRDYEELYPFKRAILKPLGVVLSGGMVRVVKREGVYRCDDPVDFTTVQYPTTYRLYAERMLGDPEHVAYLMDPSRQGDDTDMVLEMLDGSSYQVGYAVMTEMYASAVCSGPLVVDGVGMILRRFDKL